MVTSGKLYICVEGTKRGDDGVKDPEEMMINKLPFSGVVPWIADLFECHFYD